MKSKGLVGRCVCVCVEGRHDKNILELDKGDVYVPMPLLYTL